MFIFVCWTPYQVFNAINFVCNDIEGSKDNTDIYIYHEFSSSEVLSAALKQCGVFCNVYDIDVYDKKKVWYSKFNKIKRLIMPYSTIKKYLRSDIDVRKKRYKHIVISGNNLFSVNMYNAIKGLKAYFIDDGLGTYFGDIREDMTWIYKLFNKVFHLGPLSYKVKKLYVNNKSICKSTITDNILQLPAILPNSSVYEKLKEVFSYQSATVYTENRKIYLTQPLQETAIGEKAIQINKDILSILGDNTTVRIHPRQDKSEFDGYKKDECNNLWELECVEQITDEHILIGAYSTAQFMPKILCDKEPTIVFLLKLYGDIYEGFIPTIDMLRSMYRNPEKIIIVNSLDELKALNIKNFTE